MIYLFIFLISITCKSNETDYLNHLIDQIKNKDVVEFDTLLKKSPPISYESFIKILDEASNPELSPIYTKILLSYFNKNFNQKHNNCLNELIYSKDLVVSPIGVQLILNQLKSTNKLNNSINFISNLPLEEALENAKTSPSNRSIIIFDHTKNNGDLHNSVMFVDKNESPPKCVFLDSTRNDIYERYTRKILRHYDECDYFDLKFPFQNDGFSCPIFAIHFALTLQNEDLSDQLNALGQKRMQTHSINSSDLLRCHDANQLSSSPILLPFMGLTQSLATINSYLNKVFKNPEQQPEIQGVVRTDIPIVDIALRNKILDSAIFENYSDFYAASSEIDLYYNTQRHRTVNGAALLQLHQYIRYFLNECYQH